MTFYFCGKRKGQVADLALRDALPRASFIGFTDTPIEERDANTHAVFGDYIDVYDIKQAVDDRATVNIFYEGRLAKIGLDPRQLPEIDEQFDEVNEGEENVVREHLKRKWRQWKRSSATRAASSWWPERLSNTSRGASGRAAWTARG